jgi:hypothetical protein
LKQSAPTSSSHTTQGCCASTCKHLASHRRRVPAQAYTSSAQCNNCFSPHKHAHTCVAHNLRATSWLERTNYQHSSPSHTALSLSLESRSSIQKEPFVSTAITQTLASKPLQPKRCGHNDCYQGARLRNFCLIGVLLQQQPSQREEMIEQLTMGGDGRQGRSIGPASPEHPAS